MLRPEHEETVIVPAGRRELECQLMLPVGARALVLFAQGGGSSNQRSQLLAAALRERGLGTLVFDLLTSEEAATPPFDVPLLASRLSEVTEWMRGRRATRGLPLGYLGASTGSAAALIAAAKKPRTIFAIVSRGGRPELARDALERVQAPTLLIVGGEDAMVLEQNEGALERIPARKHLAVVPGATALFEEPGSLYEVERLAGDWFLEHLQEAERPMQL